MLVARVALAWVFIVYGAGKLFGAFGGAGLSGTATFMAQTAHLHPGMLFAVLSGSVEFFGGIAVGVGILGRLAALGLLGDMVVATATVTFGHGVVGDAAGVGYGLNLALAALAAMVILQGTGAIGVGAVARGRHTRPIGMKS